MDKKDLELKIKSLDKALEDFDIAQSLQRSEQAKQRNLIYEELRVNQQELKRLQTEELIQTMSYVNGVFMFNGETHVIKRERVERIVKHVSEYMYENTKCSVILEYKPNNTTRVNEICIPCANETQADTVYQTVRKIILGV
jgi:uncharacterized protein (UPF0216 family)